MITEGGNVFKDAQGQSLTQRIQKNQVPATIRWLEQLTGLDLTGDEVDDEGVPTRWLGSTGRRDDSGDLDLVVTGTTKDQLFQQLATWVQQQGKDPKSWLKKGGELHFRTPIAGDPKNGFVQTDFNFYATPDATRWAQFYMSGSSAGYKGMTRNVLLSSLAKSLGLKVGGNGLISRTTNELVQGGQDPDRVAEILLGPGHKASDLRTVEKIYAVLADDPKRDAKLADFRGYLETQGLEEPSTAVRESEVNFLARLRDRIINQGMYALIEAEADPAAKRKDPRIPHPEDAFFLGGTAAANTALQGLESAAANDKNITIKWDGKPALIWGRMPNGRLAIMDKYMFDAGFAAQSPEDWVKYDQQKASGKLRTDLYPKIKSIWPGLDAATKGPGFYWGDMLWSGELKPTAGEYTFKPNFVEYSIPANSDTGRVIAGKNGGVVVHQQFANLGDKKAAPWSGKGLQNVPGGAAILTPTLGTRFKLSKPNLSAAKAAIKQYGAAVDDLLNGLPVSIRQKLQTYFNQRITGGTVLSLHNWLKLNISAKQYAELVTGYTDPQGRQIPGKLFTMKGQQLVPSAAYTGLLEIWNAIYTAKLAMAQQLEQQVQGLKQRSGAAAEGEGFVVNTPYGLIKLVNRGVFSAGNRQLNNPT